MTRAGSDKVHLTGAVCIILLATPSQGLAETVAFVLHPEELVEYGNDIGALLRLGLVAGRPSSVIHGNLLGALLQKVPKRIDGCR